MKEVADIYEAVRNLTSWVGQSTRAFLDIKLIRYPLLSPPGNVVRVDSFLHEMKHGSYVYLEVVPEHLGGREMERCVFDQCTRAASAVLTSSGPRMR